MSKLEKIVEELSTLTVLEAAELATMLEEKWGVTAATGGGMMMAMPAAEAAPAAEVQTEFDVILVSGGEKKIGVIKVVREVVPGLGLKEAKDLVDGAPKPIKEAVSKEEAESLKKKFEEAGATIQIK